MHPTIHQQLAKARTADLLRQAERDRLAHAASQARKAHDRRFVLGDLATVLARRVRAVLAARSLRPPPSQPAQAPEANSLPMPASCYDGGTGLERFVRLGVSCSGGGL